MRDLISSCYEAEEKFRSAAASSEDDTLKRLFEIYAQQRTRFAEELREHLHSNTEESEPDSRFAWNEADNDNSLRGCLDTDLKTLQLYRQALASRELPTRTHFLIASQLALLERAHDRVNSLLQKPDTTPRVIVVNGGRARA
jgi:hypothetical protein